jgi:hypothetical protein
MFKVFSSVKFLYVIYIFKLLSNLKTHSMKTYIKAINILHNTKSNNHLALYDVPPTCFGLNMAIIRESLKKENGNGRFC